MKILNRRDIWSALVTGLTTGVIAWLVLGYLQLVLPLGIAPVTLVPVVPVLWLLGVQLGYALGVAYRPFVQFGRYAAIGFTNAAVDFGVLYLLIAATGIAAGLLYTAFKTISFTVATAHSYLWNKFWAFDAGRSHGGGQEAASFLGVSLVSLLVNVGTASIVVSLRPAGVGLQSWAGIGAIAGSAIALLFSFVGFRVFVFGKK